MGAATATANTTARKRLLVFRALKTMSSSSSSSFSSSSSSRLMMMMAVWVSSSSSRSSASSACAASLARRTATTLASSSSSAFSPSSSSGSGGGGARAAFLLILSLFVRRRKSQRNSINYNLFYAYSILSSLFFLSLSLSLHPCSFSLFESYRLHLLLPRCEIFSRIASFHSVERLAVQLVQVPQRVDVFFVILVHDVFRNRVVSVRFLSNL